MFGVPTSEQRSQDLFHVPTDDEFVGADPQPAAQGVHDGGLDHPRLGHHQGVGGGRQLGPDSGERFDVARRRFRADQPADGEVGQRVADVTADHGGIGAVGGLQLVDQLRHVRVPVAAPEQHGGGRVEEVGLPQHRVVDDLFAVEHDRQESGAAQGHHVRHRGQRRGAAAGIPAATVVGWVEGG